MTLSDNPTCSLSADGRQLRRVFYNLVDNAIKSTDAAGQITVNSRVTTDAAMISVSDSGAGIPPEHLPRIFDRFYRVDPSRTGDNDGAGLGLSICQSIVRGCGGTIVVESAIGEGTTVTVKFPREASVGG